MPLIRRVLVRMIGFINALVTHSLLITFKYRQNSAIVHLHTFQFTGAGTMGFFVSTCCFPATDLNTQTITVSLNHTLQILHIKSSLHRNTLHISRQELTWTADLPYNSHFRYYSLSLNWKLSWLYITQLSFLMGNFWTPSLNWKLSLQITRSCLLRLRTSRGCLPLRTNCKWASVSPVNPWSDTWKATVFLLLRVCDVTVKRGGHVIPPYCCAIQAFTVVA
jgi:hypothetical protein